MLGAVLQQRKNNDEWKQIHIASRFLTELESKNSANELKLLAVAWSAKNFRNYVSGTQSYVILDQKALSSVLKGNRSDSTYSSKLTRWVDRLLPFQFATGHAPGRTLGIADHLSRHPSPIQGEAIKAEELWNSWSTVDHVNTKILF